MASYKYRIYDSVYHEIISGKKTIEYRLLNEKSAAIKKGDEIVFMVLDNDKTVVTEVVDKFLYNNLDELLNSEAISNNNLGFNDEAFTKAFYDIFGKDNVNNSKIVGIEFKIK